MYFGTRQDAGFYEPIHSDIGIIQLKCIYNPLSFVSLLSTCRYLVVFIATNKLLQSSTVLLLFTLFNTFNS